MVCSTIIIINFTGSKTAVSAQQVEVQPVQKSSAATAEAIEPAASFQSASN